MKPRHGFSAAKGCLVKRGFIFVVLSSCDYALRGNQVMPVSKNKKREKELLSIWKAFNRLLSIAARSWLTWASASTLFFDRKNRRASGRVTVRQKGEGKGKRKGKV